MKIAEVEYTTFDESVRQSLEQIGAGDVLAKQERILIKPNLINSSPPPVTTPVECTEAVVNVVREWSKGQVLVAEGCGSPTMETPEIFDALGYADMAKRQGVELVDLNSAETVRLEDSGCVIFPGFHIPKLAMESYIISVPVLKAHSIADITGSMKNMMGFAPPSHYQRSGHWKKSGFHARMHESIVELNKYRSADLTVMDASIGLSDYHLGGPHCDPPLARILAGFDARQVDRRGAELLGLDWRGIGHLS